MNETEKFWLNEMIHTGIELVKNHPDEASVVQVIIESALISNFYVDHFKLVISVFKKWNKK